MKILKKKIFGIEAAAMLLFISVASGSSFVNQDTINENGIFNSSKEQFNSNTQTFIVEVNPISRNPTTNRQCGVGELPGYKVQLSAMQVDNLLSTVKRLDSAFNSSKDPKEKMSIFEEKLKVLREVGILPSSFTVVNMSLTSQWLTDTVIDNVQGLSKDYNRIKFLQPILGVGVGLIALVPSEIKSIPMPFGLFYATASSQNIPLFKTREGWTLALNFTTMLCAYTAELVISLSALSFSLCSTALPPSLQLIVGPFYSFWGCVAGFSITVYGEWYPKVILLDLCIYGGITAVVIPFINIDAGG